MASWESAPLVEETASAPVPAWQSAPLAESGPRDFGIDWSRPVEEVRAEVAKLSEADRPEALRQWADAYVARERAAPDRHNEDFVRGVARGTIVGSFLDEANAATSAAAHRLTGGRLGAPYDEALAYQRAQDRAFDKERPILSAATQIGGAFASAAPILSVPRTLAGRVALGGGVVGPGHGFVAGFGNAEPESETGTPEWWQSRLAGGERGAVLGAILGAAAPVGVAGVSAAGSRVAEAVSPTMARWGANLSQLPRRFGISASADEVADSPGAVAAARQVIANQLLRGNRTVDDLRGILSGADEARTFHTSGVAQNRLALADLDPSLQRLAGSAVRNSPEAAGIAGAFLRTRQTGLTPTGRALEPDAGIPHRPALSRPLLGRDAQRQFGTSFETPARKPVPTGQGDALLDGYRRALRIEDEVHHDHGANAYRTLQTMERKLKNEANKLYPAAWKNAEDFDLTTAFDNLAKMRLEINDPGVHSVIGRALRLFSRPDGNGGPLGTAAELRRFDLGKQRLDGLIDRYKTTDTFLYRALTGFKSDLLDAVHGGSRTNPTRNASYAEARNFYFTQKQAQEAIELGRAAVRGDSNVGVDAFHSLESEALRKFFRLGAYGGVEDLVKSKKFGADKTQIFDNPRMEELNRVIIPRTETATGRVKKVKGEPAAFANRPERFGSYVSNEHKMVQTRNVVEGNSATQGRAKDDEAFEALNTVSEAQRAIERFRQSGSLLNVVINGVEAALNKVFGMRADTAASIARQLFTADRMTQARILAGIEQRMGKSRFEQFNALMQQQQAAFAVGGARAGTSALEGPQQQR